MISVQLDTLTMTNYTRVAGVRRIVLLLNEIDDSSARTAGKPGKVVACQRFLLSMIASAAEDLAADFAFLSTRFSLRDFPDFLAMDDRGDLSDIFGPLISGGLSGPYAS